MEFLEKVVQNERTGANISGIQIDVNTQHLLDKPFLKGFEELEKLAKEMDAIKIKNKRTEFELNLEQMDLDFAEKWNDPNIYKDKEKYEAMLEDRKNLQSEKIKLLNSNIYYNRDEKLNLKKDLDNKNKGIILGYQKNRNIEYLKETINSTNANIDQIIAIGQKNISPTDYDSISKYVKRISENLSYLKTPLGLSDKELENMIGTRSKTLINGIYQEHLNKIISDPNMSIDKQEIELKKLAYSMDNKEYKEKLATDLANEFAKEDVAQAKEYFLTSFDSETKTIINQYRARFNEIKRARAREEKAMKKLYLRNQKIEQTLRSEKYSDIRKAFKKKYGRDMTDNDIANGLVDYDWDSAGDLDNYNEVNIFDKTQISNLRRNINAQIENGKMSEVKAKNMVRDYAEKLFKNYNGPDKELKVNAYIKQYADKDNPIPYAYGKEYPELYQAERVNKNSKGNYTNVNIKIPEKGFISWFDDEGYDEWNDLKKDFSADPVYADAQLKNYIIGVMKEDGYKESQINSTTMQPYLKKLNTDEGKRLINASKVLKSGRPRQNTKSNTVNTKKDKMGGYLR